MSYYVFYFMYFLFCILNSIVIGYTKIDIKWRRLIGISSIVGAFLCGKIIGQLI